MRHSSILFSSFFYAILFFLFLFYHFSLDEGKDLLLILYNEAWEQAILGKIACLQATYNVDGLIICGLDNR